MRNKEKNSGISTLFWIVLILAVVLLLEPLLAALSVVLGAVIRLLLIVLITISVIGAGAMVLKFMGLNIDLKQYWNKMRSIKHNSNSTSE